MEYRIEKKPAMRVVGYLFEGDWELEEAQAKIVAFWDELTADGGGRIHDVLSLMDGHDPQALMGVCGDGDELRGYLACVVTDALAPEGMVAWDVPAATYAVFDCVGPASVAIGELTHRIMTEWLPSSGYEWASTPNVEIYSGPRMTGDDYRSQIWLPVEKRRS